MGENSGISWTDHTFNAWWGCVKVSEACKNCYAETWAKRMGFDLWGADAERRFFGDAHWNEPRKWNAKAKKLGTRYRVFINSMSDIGELLRFDHPDFIPMAQARTRLADLVEELEYLDFLFLTKRPETLSLCFGRWHTGWPSNAWVGTTVENQQRADERIPALLQIPARIHWLSCEPLFGPVDLTKIIVDAEYPEVSLNALTGLISGPDDVIPSTINWVITGGESGAKARPANTDWYRLLRDQCAEAGVAFHFKQHGEWVDASCEAFGKVGGPLAHIDSNGNLVTEPPRDEDADIITVVRVGKKAAGRLLDGREWNQFAR